MTDNTELIEELRATPATGPASRLLLDRAAAALAEADRDRQVDAALLASARQLISSEAPEPCAERRDLTPCGNQGEQQGTGHG